MSFEADGYCQTFTVNTATAEAITTVDMVLCHAAITGRVVDALTGEPIAGATVSADRHHVEESWYYDYGLAMVYDIHVSTSTDEQGMFILSSLPLAGNNGSITYSVSASAEGYHSQGGSATIGPGATFTLGFSLGAERDRNDPQTAIEPNHAIAGFPVKTASCELAQVHAEQGNGANELRTHDLLHAMQALSQLSYGPGSSSRHRSLAAGSGR